MRNVVIPAAALLNSTPNDVGKARLLATSAKESGAFGFFYASYALGLRMDDHTLRVAVGLPQWLLHISVNIVVTKGRHHRYASVNSIIHRALTTAKFPSRLEPAGCLDLMASIQMEQHWYPGLEGNCWYGIPHVLIHWHHHSTSVRLQVQLVKLLLLLKRKRLASMQCLNWHTVLCL